MAASGIQIPGLRILLVTKHLKPEWLHRAIERARARCQVSATYEPKTLRDVLRHLKAGQVVGFVLDQYAGAPVGMRVPVFGIPVGTTTAVAMLAKRTGAPVLPIVNYRLPGGDYRVDIRPPLAWELSPTEDADEEIGINTAHYAAVLEKDIYAHPEQWLWSHRRFKGDLSPLRPNEWYEGRPRR
jgi:KDO2-lipid IV(A) lauroyltransferase